MDKIPKNNKQEAIIRHVGTGKIPKINNCPDPFISYIRVDINASVVRTRISSAFLVIFSRRMADLVTRL